MTRRRRLSPKILLRGLLLVIRGGIRGYGPVFEALTGRRAQTMDRALEEFMADQTPESALRLADAARGMDEWIAECTPTKESLSLASFASDLNTLRRHLQDVDRAARTLALTHDEATRLRLGVEVATACLSYLRSVGTLTKQAVTDLKIKV